MNADNPTMNESTSSENDQEFIEMLDEFSIEPPSNFFEREPSKETTLVRTMNFALRSIVGQLRIPINTEAEAITKWLIYKQAGPHRHQKFFGHFRQMGRLLKKYNDMTLIKKLNSVLKRVDGCGDNMYKLEKTAIQYMGCAYVKRVYLLERIRETCVKCADGAIGLLELEHWTNLCLVVVALCSQVHSEVVSQILEMERAYKTAAIIFQFVDKKFPEKLNDLRVVQKLKQESKLFDDRKIEKSNLSAISRLLKYSTEKIEEAQAENEMRMRTTEILNEVLTADMTIISTPESSKSKQKSVVAAQLDMSDLGIAISREDASFLNSTVQSCSAVAEFNSDEDDGDSLLMSPNLFAPKSLKKKKLKNKRKNPEAPEASSDSTPKKILKTNFLASTLDLLSSSEKKKKTKKKKLNN